VLISLQKGPELGGQGHLALRRASGSLSLAFNDCACLPLIALVDCGALILKQLVEALLEKPRAPLNHAR
jgi:hypothetical protein